MLLALAFFAGPPLLKSLLVTRASEELGRKVSVGDIRLNPLLLTLEVRDFEIQEPAGGKRFVAFRRLLVDLETESLYRRGPVLREVVLEQPYVNVVRLPGNRLISRISSRSSRRRKRTIHRHHASRSTTSASPAAARTSTISRPAPGTRSVS